MNSKAILFLLSILALSACFDNTYNTDKICGHAIIVDNFKDKNSLEGLYIEIEYTKDEGYTFHYLSSSTTDKNGYFEIDTEFENGYFNIDSWTVANVYSDSGYSDTLGSFGFQFGDNTYDYKTIYLDTFSLSHNIWVIPRIRSLVDFKADEMAIHFYNCELVDTSLSIMTFYEPIDVNQNFTPIEIKMTMNIQHWLSYGTRNFARGSLMIDSEEVGFGYFKLEGNTRTIDGDTLYLNFDIEEED